MGVIASSAVARLGYERFWSDFGSNGGRLERTPNLQSNAVNVGLENIANALQTRRNPRKGGRSIKNINFYIEPQVVRVCVLFSFSFNLDRNRKSIKCSMLALRALVVVGAFLPQFREASDA